MTGFIYVPFLLIDGASSQSKYKRIQIAKPTKENQFFWQSEHAEKTIFLLRNTDENFVFAN